MACHIYDSGDKIFIEFLQQKSLLGWPACFLSINSFNENPIHRNWQITNETSTIPRPMDVERIDIILLLFCIWLICFSLNLWEACAAGAHNNKQTDMFTNTSSSYWVIMRSGSECQQWKSRSRTRGVFEILIHWCQWVWRCMLGYPNHYTHSNPCEYFINYNHSLLTTNPFIHCPQQFINPIIHSWIEFYSFFFVVIWPMNIWTAMTIMVCKDDICHNTPQVNTTFAGVTKKWK